ncbi:PEBP-like protein [Lactarius akahatsu]|uniref:PEBP-like protein n=1 Tax=Lactarius akahatsu TaxID=416441 RepID=A0AAD4Q7B2_9AGAM|nr:PEBP-like protein [Lactarius akahatsu]KAH8979617.1 PEBP-like protein [Lactarius akahatsu]
MFTLPRLRALRVPLARANSTLESLSSASSITSPPASSTPSDAAAPHDADSVSTLAPRHRTQGRKNLKYPAIRPSINVERPREWNPPVAPGAIPAYDQALAYIRADAAAVQVEADALRLSIEKGVVPTEDVEDAKKRLEVLEVMAQINLPEVRWKAANGMADMSQKVYRHLVEQRWRNEGALDLLMERLYQMHVIPDVLPVLQPTVDLRVVLPEGPPKDAVLRARAKRKTAPVEAGALFVNEQTRRPPKLYATVFHPEPRFYTLLMVDPDVPDEESQSFRTYLHWLQPNISLSATSAGLLPSIAHTPYVPPHPARGTPYHRYVLLLLPHADPTAKLSLPPGPLERDAFDVRKFVQDHALGTNGGGAFMWRAVWDLESSRIWREVIKKPEPRYGYPPKPDPYGTLKEAKRYV